MQRRAEFRERRAGWERAGLHLPREPQAAPAASVRRHLETATVLLPPLPLLRQLRTLMRSLSRQQKPSASRWRPPGLELGTGTTGIKESESVDLWNAQAAAGQTARQGRD